MTVETRPEVTPQKSEFLAKLEARWAQGNFVCVGLDSDYSQIPQHLKDEPYVGDPVESAIFKFNRMIIDATHNSVCAYKPNIAFYEAQGVQGLKALQETIAYIKRYHPDIPVILDAKRADIGNTNNGYVKAIFDELGADAVTVNPYFGQDGLKPFLDRKDKGIIVLVKTSNVGSKEFQDLVLEGSGEPLWERVARNVAREWNVNGNCAVVVGATHPLELQRVRKIVGDMPILIPGIGKQGGDLEKSVKGGRDSRSWGMIINSSSGIIFASKGEDFAQAAGKAAADLNNEINFHIKHPEGLTESQEKLADLIFDTRTVAPVKRRITLSDGSFKFEQIERPTAPIDFAQEGEFALKLHEKKPDAALSPVYINLRNLPSEIIEQIGVVMAEIKTSQILEVCTGIPKAGVALAKSYSEHSGVPYIDIFEKEETEQGRKIIAGQGEREKKKLRIVDDMVTEGHTKLEAIKAAEEMGYEVTDIIVVVDRERGAKQQLKEAGYTLNAAFTLDQLLRYGLRTGRITQEQYSQVTEYLASQK